MKRALAIMVFVFGSALAARAAAPGENLFNFLFLDADARVVGLGGAYTGLAGDANALHYNPAGLGRLRGNDVALMRTELFEGVSQNYLALAMRPGFGFQINHVDLGEARRTTISNPTGAGLDDIGASDLAFTAGYGRAIVESLALGASAKWIRESIAGSRAQGVAFDIGAHYLPFADGRLSFGAVVQNLGPGVRFDSATEKLPLNFRFGAASVFESDRIMAARYTVAVDVTKERGDDPLFHAGIESTLRDTVAFRAGFSTRNDAGIGVTGGVGWRRGPFRADYAFVPFGDLGSAHRISLGYSWGDSANSRAPARVPRIKKTKSDDSMRQADGGPAGLIREAEALYAKSDFSGARRLYERALQISLKRSLWSSMAADAYAGVAVCLEKEGKPEQAVQYFMKALEAGPRTGALRQFILRRLNRLRPSNR